MVEERRSTPPGRDDDWACRPYRALSCGSYDGRLRELVHAFKYGGHRTLARTFGRWLRDTAAPLLADADCVVPVPLHWRRQLARGFNQAEAIARELGPPVRRVLRRRRHTSPQSLLPATARHANVDDAFDLVWTGALGRVRGWVQARGARWLPPHIEPPTVAGQVVVLVDDVRTTGSTLRACADVLSRAGARDVRCVTVASVSR